MNPKDETMIDLWFVSEFGMLPRQAKRAKIQVLGSRNASTILVNIPFYLSNAVSRGTGTY